VYDISEWLIVYESALIGKAMQVLTPTRESEELLQRILENRDAIAALAQGYGLKNVSLFGSVVRGDADEDSDIDILVDDDGYRGWGIVSFQLALEDLLQRKVDVIERDSIKENRRSAILGGRTVGVT
jgi:predicted nucleotidyltransferase